MPRIVPNEKSGDDKSFYLGIDPGRAGGMVLLRTAGGAGGIYEAFKFEGATDHEIADWLRERRPKVVRAALEKVGGYVGGGGQPGSAMFSFGRSYGLIQGLLTGLMIPFVEVTPQVWQKRLSIPPKKGKEKTEHKKVLQANAHKRWPARIKLITLAVADASLIAEWLRLEEVNSAKT